MKRRTQGQRDKRQASSELASRDPAIAATVELADGDTGGLQAFVSNLCSFTGPPNASR